MRTDQEKAQIDRYVAEKLKEEVKSPVEIDNFYSYLRDHYGEFTLQDVSDFLHQKDLQEQAEEKNRLLESIAKNQEAINKALARLAEIEADNATP